VCYVCDVYLGVGKCAPKRCRKIPPPLSFFLSFFLGYRKPETSDMICCLSWFVFTFGFTKHEIIPKAEEAKEGEEV
jgi:hypothetical protein